MIDNDYREVDTDGKDVSDVEETKDTTPVETGEVVTDEHAEDNEKKDDFDEFCAMCRRPASKAGKLIHVAPNMAICQDCMQKTFDTMGQMLVFRDWETSISVICSPVEKCRTSSL